MRGLQMIGMAFVGSALTSVAFVTMVVPTERKASATDADRNGAAALASRCAAAEKSATAHRQLFDEAMEFIKKLVAENIRLRDENCVLKKANKVGVEIETPYREEVRVLRRGLFDWIEYRREASEASDAERIPMPEVPFEIPQRLPALAFPPC